MDNKNTHMNQKTTNEKDKQVRGKELSSQAEASREYGEKFRSQKLHQDAIKPVKPSVEE